MRIRRPRRATNQSRCAENRRDSPRDDRSSPETIRSKLRINRTVPRIDRTAPRINVTAPRINVTAPRINLTVPRINLTVPRIDRTVPRIDRTVPRIDRTVPWIGVTAPRIDIQHDGSIFRTADRPDSTTDRYSTRWIDIPHNGSPCSTTDVRSVQRIADIWQKLGKSSSFFLACPLSSTPLRHSGAPPFFLPILSSSVCRFHANAHAAACSSPLRGA